MLLEGGDGISRIVIFEHPVALDPIPHHSLQVSKLCPLALAMACATSLRASVTF